MLNFSSPSKEIQLSLANDKDGRFDLITRTRSSCIVKSIPLLKKDLESGE